MKARSSASTPPVSANTVCTFQPRSCSHGTQKLVSRPPEKASTMSRDSFMGRCLWKGFEGSLRDQRGHHGLLDVQAVLGLVDRDARRRIHHAVGRLDAAAQ